VIFSHSSAKAITNVPRNVPDDILTQVKTNGGVVMVTFVPGFVSDEVAAFNALPADQRAGRTAPRASIIQVADHIDHIKDVAGIDAIGLGGDFDGITQVVMGLEDVSTYPDLLAELLRRGYSDEDIRKIAGKNILRAFKAAEAAARR
jgi:membrane dipeptidase